MNLVELVNQNLSKKMGIAIVGIVALAKVNAPSWQVMVVVVAAIVVQGYLDRNKTQPKE
jgi:hypothetical protein